MTFTIYIYFITLQGYFKYPPIQKNKKAKNTVFLATLGDF